MKLKTGNLNNVERKFIAVRKSNLKKYLDTLKKVESYKIIQFYSGEYKYRKFEESNDIKFTKSKKNGNVTEVNEIEEKEFLSNISNQIIEKKRTKYIDGNYIVEVDEFLEPSQLTMIEVSSENENLANYEAKDTFIEVTGNQIYSNENISKGSIKKANVIVEGTDAVGKTTTITKLLSDGIIFQDRCEDVISKNMLFDVSHEKRGEEIYNKYFSNKSDANIIFLVNFDEKELMRRVTSRGKISDFDLDAYKYGLLYKETYDYMISHYKTNGRLRLVDCTGLGVNEQYQKVRNSILKEIDYER